MIVGGDVLVGVGATLMSAISVSILGVAPTLILCGLQIFVMITFRLWRFSGEIEG